MVATARAREGLGFTEGFSLFYYVKRTRTDSGPIPNDGHENLELPRPKNYCNRSSGAKVTWVFCGRYCSCSRGLLGLFSLFYHVKWAKKSRFQKKITKMGTLGALGNACSLDQRQESKDALLCLGGFSKNFGK